MKILFGLGNPGNKYISTRHNVGFLFLDYLKEKYKFDNFIEDKKHKSLVSEGIIEGEKTLLVKPSTFMNLSGEAVQSVNTFYKIPLKDWCVVYDDISMEFGKIRTREKGSAGGHNGIKSIISHLGDLFQRIKIGVGKDEKYETSDWVLSQFTKEEKEKLDKIFENGEQELLKLLFK